MTQLNPFDRFQAGTRNQIELRETGPSMLTTLFEESQRDFVYAEVSNRPGLDRRSRFWIAIAGAACKVAPQDVINGLLRGALLLFEINLSELREGALHLAVYGGWPADRATTRVADALQLPGASIGPIFGASLNGAEKIRRGVRAFLDAMTSPWPLSPLTPHFQVGNLNLAFPQIWTRSRVIGRWRRFDVDS